MKRILFLSGFLLVVALMAAAQDMNRVVHDEVTGDEMLIGYGNRRGLLLEPFFSWFSEEYDAYSVNKQSILGIEPEKLEGVTITMVLGTWCPDSRREVPRFYKILDQLGFNESNLRVIYVNRDKQAPGINLDSLDISYVPTMVVYRNGDEIGRIIEHPVQRLEEDLAFILLKE
ncbi:MAG: thioredoxin family protein [Bacteroidales bacterium]